MNKLLVRGIAIFCIALLNSVERILAYVKQSKKDIISYTILFLLFVALCSLVLIVSSTKQPICTLKDNYVVTKGDTLFKIATTFCEGDPRKAVQMIQEENGLNDPTIFSGQVLSIPEK